MPITTVTLTTVLSSAWLDVRSFVYFCARQAQGCPPLTSCLFTEATRPVFPKFLSSRAGTMAKRHLSGGSFERVTLPVSIISEALALTIMAPDTVVIGAAGTQLGGSSDQQLHAWEGSGLTFFLPVASRGSGIPGGARKRASPE